MLREVPKRTLRQRTSSKAWDQGTDIVHKNGRILDLKHAGSVDRLPYGSHAQGISTPHSSEPRAKK
jgi:hypothetical protein